MRKLFASALVAATIAGGVGVAQAAKPDQPGKEHGQCTAAFNGQKNGWGEGHPPGFNDLYDAADTAGNGDGSTSVQELYDYCVAYGIGGQPDQNGRYTDCFTDTNNNPSDDCTDG